MPVIVSCTDLFLYFLYLFSNFIQLVPILFTPVQLCTFLKFLGKFLYVLISMVYSTTTISDSFHRFQYPPCNLYYIMCGGVHMMYNVHCYIQGDEDVKQEEGEDKKDVVGNRMLTMAGFFDIWTSSQRDVSTLLYIFSLFPSVSLFPASSFSIFSPSSCRNLHCSPIQLLRLQLMRHSLLFITACQ